MEKECGVEGGGWMELLPPSLQNVDAAGMCAKIAEGRRSSLINSPGPRGKNLGKTARTALMQNKIDVVSPSKPALLIAAKAFSWGNSRVPIAYYLNLISWLACTRHSPSSPVSLFQRS